MKRECVGYARQGECSRNPAFMLSTCRAECDAWEAENGLRIDRNARCVEWSLLGKCAEEPARMAAECNTSCTVQERCARSARSGWSVGICDKALRCEAVDKDRDCAARGGGRVPHADEPHGRPLHADVRRRRRRRAALGAGRRAPRDPLGAHRRAVDRGAPPERCWLNGWAGHNTYKLMLPTQCAAPRTLPWQRHGVPASRLAGRDADLLTCPHDVAKQTPRVAYPTVNVTLLPHTPHVVRVQQVLASPRVRLLHDFITAEEGAERLRLAEPSFHRSPVRSVATDRRTSSTATLMTRGNWAVTRVRERIAAFSGYNENALEPLQVVRYHPGEKYEPHHDLFDLCDLPQKPRRHLTFLIYLNDMEEGAGGTRPSRGSTSRSSPRKNGARLQRRPRQWPRRREDGARRRRPPKSGRQVRDQLLDPGETLHRCASVDAQGRVGAYSDGHGRADGRRPRIDPQLAFDATKHHNEGHRKPICDALPQSDSRYGVHRRVQGAGEFVHDANARGCAQSDVQTGSA